MPDPWTVLGVAPGSTLDEARRAYLVRSQLVHPDRHQGAPAAVLAEADRAMRELNDAWEEVQRQAAGGGGGHAADPPVEVTFATAADAVGWIVARLAAAAAASGDPLSEVEAARLGAPASQVDRGRGFDRWVQHRRVTLRQATKADAPDPGARLAWAKAVRLVGESQPTPVLALLIRGLAGN